MADPLPPNPFPFLTPSYAGGQGSICRADTPYPSVSQESVPSQIDNLTNALYGAITKTVQNNRVIWNIPCDPNLSSSINGIARNTNEGLLCYIIRALNVPQIYLNSGSNYVQIRALNVPQIYLNSGSNYVQINIPDNEGTLLNAFWQEIDVCVDGTAKKMQVLGTEPY